MQTSDQRINTLLGLSAAIRGSSHELCSDVKAGQCSKGAQRADMSTPHGARFRELRELDRFRRRVPHLSQTALAQLGMKSQRFPAADEISYAPGMQSWRCRHHMGRLGKCLT